VDDANASPEQGLTMTTITVQHVTKHFHQTIGDGTETRKVAALDNVSLKVASGSVLAILGPSGCGKTTLLRCIAGLEHPDSGAILYDHADLRDIPLQERGIGMVFQDGALMPHWEAEKTVGFFMWLRHRESEVPERVARISQITGIGLDKLMPRKPSQLSGGEKQRVAIARALTRDPKVFLFDEPFSSLDAKLRANARIELKKLLHEFPVTSIYVTHDQQEAITLAHRIAVMRAGQIEQIGTYRDLYYNPLNLFVATFFGTPTINLFDGVIQSHHWQGENFGGYPVRGDLDDGTGVTLGVRPEAILLSDDGVAARVESVIPFFAERHLLLELTAGRERWHMTVPESTPVKVGSTIHMAFDPDGIHCFDSKTGRRIG